MTNSRTLAFLLIVLGAAIIAYPKVATWFVFSCIGLFAFFGPFAAARSFARRGRAK